MRIVSVALTMDNGATFVLSDPAPSAVLTIATQLASVQVLDRDFDGRQLWQFDASGRWRRFERWPGEAPKDASADGPGA